MRYIKKILLLLFVLCTMFHSSKASETDNQAILADSIEQVLSSEQIDLIQELYDVNRLLLEKEQIRSSYNIIALIVILLFTVLLVLFIIRALFVHKKLKEAQYEMRIANQTAEKANDVKNLFLSNMSYNIRTPLNNVVGFSQLMAVESEMDEDQRKEYSVIIKQNSEILLNLVNDVLDISRLEAGMMKFSLQEYEIITLCQEAFYAVKRKEQPITIDFQPGFEEQQIKVDTLRFGQLLTSILTYPTPVEKPITITFTITLDKKRNCVCFKTIGSPIANSEFVTQEVTIRNDINKLFLKRFGGTYNVNTESPEGPTIVFTYPLSISE